MIKKIFKIIAIIFGFIIVLFIGITYFVLNELFDGLCGDYIFKEYPSPNKTKKVVIILFTAIAKTPLFWMFSKAIFEAIPNETAAVP